MAKKKSRKRTSPRRIVSKKAIKAIIVQDMKSTFISEEVYANSVQAAEDAE